MNYIIEGDKEAVERVETILKQLLKLKVFLNQNQSYKQLYDDLTNNEIIVNHCITKFFKSKKSKDELKREYFEAAICMRKSKSKSVYIICIDKPESPFYLTLNSQLEGDFYFILEDDYSDERLIEDIESVIEKVKMMEER